MKIIRGSYNIRKKHQGCVATIGNFDGLHLGHQALLKSLQSQAQQLKLATLVIIFEPQPNEYFAPNAAIPRLMRLREKIEALQQQGIDRVLCLPFNENLAQMTAEEFVKTVLVTKLAIKSLLIGDDFRFGYQRVGDYTLLKELGSRYSFEVKAMPKFEIQGERVSSTRIRRLLAQGELHTVKALLGRYFSIKGRIARGDQRGRWLGFPTANIALQRDNIPLKGIFAVEMLGIDQQPIPGVANIGTRPTIMGEVRTLLEVYLLDFNRDIYRHKVEVNFLHKFRDEQKFNDLEALKAKIAEDVVLAKKFHGVRLIEKHD